MKDDLKKKYLFPDKCYICLAPAMDKIEKTLKQTGTVKVPICAGCMKKEKKHRFISNIVIGLLVIAIAGSFHYEKNIIDFLSVPTKSAALRFFKLAMVLVPGGAVLIAYQFIRIKLFTKKWLNLRDMEAVKTTPSFKNSEFDSEFRKINNL